MTIGERVRQLREAQNISVSQVARKCGVDRGTIYFIEKDKTENPGALTLKALADALGVSLMALLDDGAFQAAMREIIERRYASFFAGHELAAVGAG